MQNEFTVSFGEEPVASPVERVSGLGPAEGWGRWNNDSLIAIRFERSLPRTFEASIACAVSPANVGRAITLTAGGCSRRLVCTRTLRQGVQVATLRFDAASPARTLEIFVPDVEPGGVDDVRPLGLALVSLSIVPMKAGRTDPAANG